MLLGMIEGKDHATAEHCRNVARLSVLLASACGLKARDLRDLEMGALLHEADKLNIPDEVFEKLRSGTALDKEDCAILTGHASAKGEIPFQDRMPRLVQNCQRLHHENYDGTGSPKGLKENQIPLPVRILQVADTYDALTLNLPGHQGQSREEALVSLRRLSGTVLTPELVETFIKIMEQEKEERRTSRDFSP